MTIGETKTAVVPLIAYLGLCFVQLLAGPLEIDAED